MTSKDRTRVSPFSGTGDDGDALSPLTRISLDCTDERGKRYRGEFLFKVPTLGDRISIGRAKAAALPNGSVIDPDAFILCEQIAYLQNTLQAPIPEWWKPWEMYDATPVHRLYAEATAYASRFLGKPATNSSDAGPAAEPSDDAEGSGMADADGAEPQVQPAPKRRTVISSHGT